MLNVVTMSEAERSALVELGASETGLQEAIVEKDLWVCYLLDYLFHRSEFGTSIIFKGGTSLSKAYHVIERFSEDVDLILDWRVIGYGADEPWAPRSNTKQERFRHETIARTEEWLSRTFVPSLKAGLSAELGIDADVSLASAEETVFFAYPRLYSSEATVDVVRLEIGPLAAWSPHVPAVITPYLAELHPQVFASPSTTIETAAAERTFWEKVTILHQEANRPDGKAMPRRYARHYYDLYRLAHTEVADSAIARSDLLADVVAFKEKFYRTPWAKLVEAKPGTLRLIPRESRIAELSEDYDSMRPMIFGESPSLSDIIACMGELEERVNGISKSKTEASSSA